MKLTRFTVTKDADGSASGDLSVRVENQSRDVVRRIRLDTTYRLPDGSPLSSLSEDVHECQLEPGETVDLELSCYLPAAEPLAACDGVSASVMARLYARELVRLGEVSVPQSKRGVATLECAIQSKFLAGPVGIRAVRQEADSDGEARVECTALVRNVTGTHLDRVELSCELLDSDGDSRGTDGDGAAVAAHSIRGLEGSTPFVKERLLKGATLRLTLSVFHPVLTLHCEGAGVALVDTRDPHEKEEAARTEMAEVRQYIASLREQHAKQRSEDEDDSEEEEEVGDEGGDDVGDENDEEVGEDDEDQGDHEDSHELDPIVSRVLEAAGAEEYADAFAENEIAADVLPSLSDADLLSMGVRTIGQRKRILLAIVNLGADQPDHHATGPAHHEGPTAARSSLDWQQLTDAFAAQFKGIDSVTINPASGHKKLEGAREYATRVQAGTRALLVYDDTVFRSGKDGLLVSELGVHWRNMFAEPGFVPWTSCPVATASGKAVVIDPGGSVSCAFGGAKCAMAIARFVNEAAGAAMAAVLFDAHPQSQVLRSALSAMSEVDQDDFVIVEHPSSDKFVQFCNGESGPVLDVVQPPPGSPEADRLTGLLMQLGDFDRVEHDSTQGSGSFQREYETTELNLAVRHAFLVLRTMCRVSGDMRVNIVKGWGDAKDGPPIDSEATSETSSSDELQIRHFVTINLVCENPAEECAWFGPEAEDPFPSGPMVDLFLDESDAIVGVRTADGTVTLGAEECGTMCKDTFTDDLACLGPNGRLRSCLGSGAEVRGMSVRWPGDARDLPDGERERFFSACNRKGAIVVWKQIREVDWDVSDTEQLAQLLDQGDHDSYTDFVGVV